MSIQDTNTDPYAGITEGVEYVRANPIEGNKHISQLCLDALRAGAFQDGIDAKSQTEPSTVATDSEPTLLDGILAIVKMRRERIEAFSRQHGETQFDQGRVHELKHIERVIVENQEAHRGR